MEQRLLLNHLISRKLRSHHVTRYDIPYTGHNSINDGRNFSAGANRVYTDPWLKAYAVSSQKTIDARSIRIRIETRNKVLRPIDRSNPVHGFTPARDRPCFRRYEHGEGTREGENGNNRRGRDVIVAWTYHLAQ